MHFPFKGYVRAPMSDQEVTNAFGPSASSPNNVLPLDAFVRSVQVNSNVGHALLLGAGASITSNVPSAANCIWIWKRAIFLSNNPGLEQSFEELSLGAVQSRIQDWLDRRGSYPSSGSSDEYGHYIEACYPNQDDRRAFFQNLIRAANPSIGYRLAALLAEASIVESVWTTNFDALTPRALAETSTHCIEVGLDCAERTVRPQRSGEVLCVALHGDYRYDALRNTDSELQRLDSELRDALMKRAISSPLVVLGYSGRDKSIMDALRDAYRQPGSGTLYWCAFGDGPAPAQVAELLSIARDSGHAAFYVPSAAFDDVQRRLALACLTGKAREKAQSLIDTLGAGRSDRTPFIAPNGRIGGLLKSTAFKLSCPVEAYSFKVESMPKEGVWRWLREKTATQPNLVAVPFKGRIWALGTLTAITEAFGSEVSDTPMRLPLDVAQLRYEDGAITHLALHALVASIATSRNLASHGPMVWDRAQFQTRKVGPNSFNAHDALLFYLRRIGHDTVLVLKPTVKVLKPDGSPAAKEDEKSVKLGIFGYQHNDKFNNIVEDWRRRLFGDGTTFHCPAGEDTGFRFEIDRAPISAAIIAASGEAALPKGAVDRATQRGFRISEPHLQFSSKTATGTPSDPHPIRGLSENRPYDFSMTRSGLTTEVRLGVICPARESSTVGPRLAMLEQGAAPSETERDYLLDFPGFASAFGLPLVIPKPGDSTWRYPAEPDARESAEGGTRFVARAVVHAIEELRAAQRANVILIVTPRRWLNWRSYESNTERFDLHDFVKAYCARRGIATQFIDEETLTDSQACRIRWWLSLAIYAKSFRTPFVLKSSANDTAYVGFGTSIDRFGPDGRKVVVGCSHIFNEYGQGLQYRLSKIENPIFQRRNAFLSKDDARRVGESIRQLFFEARSTLPRRVVIHKRTPFLRDEREGLIEGLESVKIVDMVEISIDEAFRYVNSKMTGADLSVDRFPVARGTVIPVGDYEAFLWVHGSAAALRNGWRYYQGKRRIPAPLLIRRHAGSTDLQTLASEILGLSKMNWNSFDLYTQVPATIETSGQMARIGRLMEGYGEASYDYRLLM
jgi:hypothetical protein